MIPVLLSIPGKLKTLIDRITLARMQKVDEITPERMGRLDAAITSRAAASTALSTTTWTNSRADNLDQIAASRMAKIDTLESRLSVARSDNLDQIASSRMTKIDTLDARWTDARAGYIDNLASPPLRIKSIQRGVVTVPDSFDAEAVATITPVDTSKTELRFCGVRSSSTTFASQSLATVTLSSATTVTARRDQSGNYTGRGTVTVSFEVTEYF